MMAVMPQRVTSPVMIGRTRESERLHAAFDRASAGQGGCVVIGGEAGVGKSRLISSFKERVEAGGDRVLVGGCIELGDDGAPLAPFIDAMRDVVDETTLGADALGVDRLFGGGPSDSGAQLAEPAAHGRLFEGFLRLLGRLAADRPTLLVIEDVHWSDRSTRDLIRYLARYQRDEPWLLVLTYRSDEIHRRHPVLPLVTELGRLASVERIQLAPFDRPETAALLALLVGTDVDRAVIERLHQRSDGNPFFVEELVAGGALTGGELPDTFRDILAVRLMSLPDDTRSILAMAATIGRRFDHQLLVELAEIRDDEAVRRLRPAIDAQILLAQDDASGVGYEFRHALVAEALYDETLGAERTILHGRLARRLEDRVVSGHPSRPSQAEIAYHWYRAHEPAAALAASVRAADEAARMTAFAEVCAHLGRALELWPAVLDAERIAGGDRAAIAERAADAAAAIGDHSRAIALGRDALAELWSASEIDRWLWASHRLAWYQFDAGDHVDAERTVAAAVEVAHTADPVAQARSLVDLAQVHWSMNRFSDQLDSATAALALAERGGDRTAAMQARMMIGTAQVSSGDVERGVRALETLLAELDSGHEELRAVTALELTYGLMIGGWYERCVELGYTELGRLRRMGLYPRYAAYMTTDLADGLIGLGHWSEAWALIEAPDWPRDGGRASAWVFEAEAELAAYQGDTDRAERALREARDRVSIRDAPIDHAWLHRADALVAMYAGRLDRASAAFSASIDRSPQPAQDHPLLYWVLWPALSCEASRAQIARANRTPAAERAAVDTGRHLLEIVERSTQAGRPNDTPADRYFVALARAEEGRLTGADDPTAWASAASEAAKYGWPHEEGWARYRYAEAQLTVGADRGPAADALRQAATLAAGLGAVPLARQVSDLATRARIDVAPDGDAPAAAGSGTATPYGLTRREREVLDLVSAGRTNREIGLALFISEKTASVHVTHILDKLGVSSRVEAALLASRMDSPG
jgi:ATP/maltotriose-dependent transcriptional regulator MalT